MLEKFEYATPIGSLTIIHKMGIVTLCEFTDRFERIDPYMQSNNVKVGDAHQNICNALDAYFVGDLCAIKNISYELSGTDFQNKAWQWLRTIPDGETRSYKDMADGIGSHARAVGGANGRNQIAIIIPCHRIIGADGSLTGYAGGLERKKWLLQHEKAIMI